MSTPALAATLSASPNQVTFNIPPRPVAVEPQAVTITGTSAAAVTPDSVTLGGDRPTFFLASIGSGSVNIAVNLSVVNQLLQTGQLPTGTYNAKATVKAAGYTDLDIPLALVVGTAAGISVSPTAVTWSSPAGSYAPTSTTLIVYGSGGNVGVNITASETTSTGTAWMQVSPVGASTATPSGLQVTITFYPSNVVAGTQQTGVISVSGGGSTINVPVTFNAGFGTGNLSANPPSVNLQYVTGQTTFPSATVYLTGPSNGTYLASPGNYSPAVSTPWLTVDGVTSYTSGAFSTKPTITVAANPSGLVNGIYQATISVQSSPDGSRLDIPVTLAVNTSSSNVSVNPVSLSFTYPYPNTTSATVYVSSSTQPNATFTATSNQSWLSVSPQYAQMPSNLTVAVNPSVLTAGIYSGAITITSNAGSTSIPVSFNVGGASGGSLVVNPTSLTFTVPSGGGTSPPALIAVSGIQGGSYTLSPATTDGANWLLTSKTSGSTPDVIQVYVIPGSKAVGTYSGTLTVNSSLGTQLVNVTMNVTSSPVLLASPSAVAFTTQPGTSTQLQQGISLSSSVAGTEFPFTITTSGASWLSVTQTSGTTPASFAVVVNTSSLATGVNSGTVTVTATGAANNPLVIPVNVVNGTGSGGGTVYFSPSAVSLTSSQLTATTVLNAPSGSAFALSANSSGNWLSVSPSSGYAPATITVTANASALTAGTYTGTITASSSGLTAQATVTLTVGGSTLTQLDVEAVNPSFTSQGGAVPAPQTIAVKSTGGQIAFAVTPTTATGGNWLSVSPLSANTPGSLNVSVNPAGLAAGTYTGTITISSPTASNSPVTRNVTLTVTGPPQLQAAPATLSFSGRSDAAAPASQTVQVSSSGAAISFTATASANWITVSPSSGTTPATLTVSVNPSSLGAGTHSGTISITGTGGSSSTASIGVTLALTGPLPTIASVTNAASYAGNAVAPGEIVTIFGTAIGPPDLVPLNVEGDRVTTKVGDVRVLFNGIPAPIVYASSTQVSAIVPYGIAGRADTFAQVEYRGVRSNSLSLAATTSAPGIFTANASGTGPAAALNQDYSLNTPSNAAARGTVVLLYATGEGQTFPAGSDGLVAHDPQNLPKPVLPVTVTIGGQAADVIYAGGAPGLVAGVLQINVRVPAGAPTGGSVPVVVNVGNGSSQSGVTIAVR